jgi:hypothetical protein
MWLLAQQEADNLVAQFLEKKSFGEETFLTCRWNQFIMVGIRFCILDKGLNFQVQMEYPLWEENHCWKVTLIRS